MRTVSQMQSAAMLNPMTEKAIVMPDIVSGMACRPEGNPTPPSPQTILPLSTDNPLATTKKAKNLMAKISSVACESRQTIFLPLDFFAITFFETEMKADHRMMASSSLGPGQHPR